MATTATQSKPAAQQQLQPNEQMTAEQQANRKLVETMLDKEIEYKPFLSETAIKLSARLVLRFLVEPTKSGKVCTNEQAVKFMMLCQARALNPWEGDAYLVGYDTKDGPRFSLITAHQAFLKRAEAHPAYQGMQSGVMVKDPKPGTIIECEGDYVDEGLHLLGGWSKVFRKDRSVPTFKRLKLSAFNKGQSRWSIDAAGMIVKCAEADALRSAFPNSLGGMFLREELAAIEAAADAPAPAAPLPVGRSDLRKSNGNGHHDEHNQDIERPADPEVQINADAAPSPDDEEIDEHGVPINAPNKLFPAEVQ